MSINQRLDLKQGQTLTMTPQLQQAIKLLQMSNLELAAFVEAELEKNPLLERDDSLSSERPDIGDDAPVADHGMARDENDRTSPVTADRDRPLDADFGNVFTGESRAEQQGSDAHGDGMAAFEGGYDAFATDSFGEVGRGGSSDFSDSAFSFENTIASEKTLRDHLNEQIQVEFDLPKDRAIAGVLMDFLDEAGYFRGDLNAIAARLGCDIAIAEDILDTLQRLDPPGIFARSLRECLALQLREKDRLDPAMQALLDHLDLLGAHDLKKLKAVCGVSDDDLKDMIAEIRKLDPKPALMFEHLVVQTVVPDVLMRPLPKSKGGGWSVELNNDTLPRVLVNKRYYAEIEKGARDKTARDYLSDQMASANWLIRAMEQRAETIMKVATQIILQQENFFIYGVEYMKPMVLRDIAAEIGMHESTVSRVTTGKYIGTPRGVFELKYFFSSGVSSADGAAAYSSEAIKARIKTLIDAETIDAILSDDDLVEKLTAEGIDIARRTVAKYREAMKIPSSVQRRRQKKG